MADTTTLNETTRSPIDGTEAVRLATPGANWKATLSAIANYVLGNAFVQFTGPATSAKTFTLPNADSTILTTNAVVTVPQGGSGAATFTAHGVLVGEGTSAFAALSVGATGTLLAGATGADPAFSATPTLGANGGTGGAVTLKGSTSGSVAVQVAAAAGTGTVFQLPATNGTSGYVLQTNGSGVTSWVAASGGAPGGADTNVQFNSSSAFGGDSGFTYAGSGQATLALGTITANAKAVNITGTFNNAAITFDAPLFMNITDTASNAASLLADLQVGSSSKFSVTKSGFVYAALGSATVPAYRFGATTTLGFGSNGSQLYAIVDGNTAAAFLSNISRFADQIAFAPSTADNAHDILLVRESAGILAQRFSTTAQTFRLYNTFTDASNYERLTLDWKTTANVCYLRNENAGTGSARIMVPVTGSTTVSGLPAASTAGAGARSFVTDATATTYLSTVAGTGSNKVPVVSDGTNWLIG